MANKHEVREPIMKSAVWVRFEPGTNRFYVGPSRSGTNKKARLGQETKHGLFTSKHVEPAFFTKTYFSARFRHV